MYTVIVKDHIMIAHSLPDPFFGPAQHMHGATFAVEAIFSANKLTDKNVVLDIGEAAKILKEVLSKLAYKNLDDLPQFENVLTTTEFMAKFIHDEILTYFLDNMKLKIILHENPSASASYEG
ncbi:MAG: 6-pyruvoyltetrahydropterin/6-carboxytetrahydropterin synthase [Sediminicola sp.]|jgi:6-pyruvoyltetrahydropterin/6-carboxytetrahydropterin synthase